MSSTTFPPRPDRRLTGIAATVALHLALLWGWSVSMRLPAPSEEKRTAIEWVNVSLPRLVPRKAPAPQPVARRKSAARAPHAPAPAAPPPPPVAAAPNADAPAVEAPAVPAPPQTATRSAAEMMEQAKRDIGKFDKELRKEFATRGISKPADSPQLRLAQGIEDAYDAVPPKWYESAKIKEIIDPGQYGRKRYRITTAFGTFCMTYESPNSPTGQLDIGKRVEPKMTNCPAHEQPATVQKW